MQERYAAILRISNQERAFAPIIGILFLFIGIAGFIPGLISMPAVASNAPLDVPNLTLTDGYGNVLGLFPTNFLHNAVHIAVGVLGIAAASSFSESRQLSVTGAVAILCFCKVTIVRSILYTTLLKYGERYAETESDG